MSDCLQSTDPINSNNNSQALSRQISNEVANGKMDKMDAITRSQSHGHGMMKHGYTSVPSHLVQNLDVPPSMQTTLSQPFLHDEHGHPSHMHKSMSRTFSRPDILYQGSLHNIPHYRSHGDLSVANMDKYGSIRHVNEPDVSLE